VSCKSCKELMNVAGRETLTPEQQAQFKAHLASCETCRGQWDVQKMLGSLSEPRPIPDLPPFLASRVMAAVSAEAEQGFRRQHSSFWRSLPLGIRLAGTFAAVALTVGAAVLGAGLAARSGDARSTGRMAKPAPLVSTQSDWTGFFEAESEDLPLGWYLAGDPAAAPAGNSVRPDRPKEK